MGQVATTVISPAALYFLLVPGPVNFPSLERLAHCQSPTRSARSMLPRSVWPSVLPVPVFPPLLETVPSPVAEFSRPLEPVPSPVAPDPALVRVVPMSQSVLPPQPPPW